MIKIFKQFIAIALCSMVVAGCASKQADNHGIIDLKTGWQLFSSRGISTPGDVISTAGFSPDTYYPIQVPSTVMSGLIQNGLYPDIYFGGQLEKVDREQFASSWWYRNVFKIENIQGRYFTLNFEGINYYANIWLNGKLIADSTIVQGPFAMWSYDVSHLLVAGDNVLAVEVSAPKWGDLTIGFVDWSPEAPDKNMGLWRGVHLVESGEVSIHHPFVASAVNTATLDEASLTVSTRVKNNTSMPQCAVVTASFDKVKVSQEVTLEPNQDKEVVFTPKQFSQLIIKNPKLWWPVNLGEPVLHQMYISASVQGKVSHQNSFRFGIRQIETYRNQDDHLGFKVNGQEVLIKGGGWVDDMLLADSDEKVIAQVDYTKHMNLNAIRLEGFWGRNKTIYERCDEQGVMLMIGWSCQWEWEGYCGRPESDYMCIYDPAEQEQQAKAYVDQVLWLRNHPSVFLWNFGSDKLPAPELEKLLHKYIGEVDTTRHLLSHCGGKKVSELTGTSGVKMNGPYDWVSPNYWYIDKKYGGAFGFNTETGPGPQIPTLETVKRMFPADQLWPMGPIWDYHSGRFEFSNINRFLNAFNTRYGKEETLERFVFKNQISNYEAMRPMFEAFAANRPNSTGVIQWMLNSAWPKIIWQLYDYFLVPNAAFYATKKACAPLAVIYNYGDKNIYIHNERNIELAGLNVKVSVFDTNSTLLYSASGPASIGPNQSKLALNMPMLQNLPNTYFLDVRLTDRSGTELANNFYWLSTKEETHKWDATYWLYTPGIEYADLTGINSMPPANVLVKHSISESSNDIVVEVELCNQSKTIAFFTELRVVNASTGKTIVPVFWDDNYVTLLGQEKRVVRARFAKGDLRLNDLKLEVTGWNVDYQLH